jgi:hypothetical protein
MVLTIKDIAEPEEMGSQKPKASKGHKKLKNGRRGVFVSLLDLNIINSSSMVILTPHVDDSFIEYLRGCNSVSEGGIFNRNWLILSHLSYQKEASVPALCHALFRPLSKRLTRDLFGMWGRNLLKFFWWLSSSCS